VAIKNLKGRAEVKADSVVGGKKFNKRLLKSLQEDGYFVDKFYKIKFKKSEIDKGCEIEDVLKVCKKWIKNNNGNQEVLKSINKAISAIERD